MPPSGSNALIHIFRVDPAGALGGSCCCGYTRHFYHACLAQCNGERKIWILTFGYGYVVEILQEDFCSLLVMKNLDKGYGRGFSYR